MKTIYRLRSQCDICKLDKMNVFYRPDKAVVIDKHDHPKKATPANIYKAHEEQMRRVFPKKYNCSHPITFTHEVEREYMWDEKKAIAVKR